MNMKVENEMALPITKSVTVMLLEPYAGKLARTVFRGEDGSNVIFLLDVYKCSESLRSRKAKQYPTHYKDSRTARYKDDIAKKKICADCVGLIKGYNWVRPDRV